MATGVAGAAGTAGDLRVGFGNTGGTLYCRRCVATSAAGNGFGTANALIILEDCIARELDQASSAGGHGVQIFGDGDFIINNFTARNLEGSGVFTNGANGCENSRCDNSAFVNISRFGFEGATGATALTTAAYAHRYRKNAFYNCVQGQQGGAVAVFGAGQDEIILTADPHVSDTDLSPNALSGGGVLLRQAGIPGAFHGLSSTTGYLDVGAVQASATSGAGTFGQVARSLWRELTNERNTTRVPDATIDIYLQLGLNALNRRVKYHYNTDTTTIALTAGTQEYALPTDFCEVVFVEHAGKEIKKASVALWRKEEFDAWRRETADGPMEYAIYANKIAFRPTPDAAAVAAGSTATIRYVNTPPDVGASGFDQLGTQDHSVVVFYAVGVWFTSYKASVQVRDRGEDYFQLFETEAKLILAYYDARNPASG
jgi:hypothetical protein